ENYKKILENRPDMTEEKMNRLLTNPAFNPKLINDETLMLRTAESLSYATAFMILEAYNQELGCCIIGGIGNEITSSIPEVYAVVREELSLPDDMFILSLLAVGYPNRHKMIVSNTDTLTRILFPAITTAARIFST